MANEGKTFFEVFSQGAAGKQAKGSGSERPGEDLLVISDTGGGKPRKNWKGPYRIGLATVVLGAIGGVLLAVGCFFLGLKLGGTKDVAKVQPKPAVVQGTHSEKTVPKQPAPAVKHPQERPSSVSLAKTSVAPKPGTGKDTWSLRVISYKEGANSLQRATGLAHFLKDRTGQDAFVAKQGSQIVVCLGEFDSRDNPKLAELQKLVKGFKYEDKTQFAGCYPVKVR
jgi:hypothetical protein